MLWLLHFDILNTCICITGGIYNCGPSNRLPVIFSAEVETVTIDIPITDDNIIGDDKKFRVSINPDSLPYCVSLGSINEAIVTIVDDECEYSWT